MPKVRCAGCGFLTARDIQTRKMVEVEAAVRATWAIPSNPTFSKKWHEEIPFCFALAADLREEIGTYSTSRVLQVIGEERECKSFTEWRHGYTPREHQEMQIAEQAQRFQEERREKDDVRQAQRDEAQRAWQAEQSLKQTKEARKTAIFAALTSVVVGAAVGLVVGVFKGDSNRPPQPQQAAPATSPSTASTK